MSTNSTLPPIHHNHHAVLCGPLVLGILHFSRKRETLLLVFSLICSTFWWDRYITHSLTKDINKHKQRVLGSSGCSAEKQHLFKKLIFTLHFLLHSVSHSKCLLTEKIWRRKEPSFLPKFLTSQGRITESFWRTVTICSLLSMTGLLLASFLIVFRFDSEPKELSVSKNESPGESCFREIVDEEDDIEELPPAFRLTWCFFNPHKVYFCRTDSCRWLFVLQISMYRVRQN